MSPPVARLLPLLGLLVSNVAPATERKSRISTSANGAYTVHLVELADTSPPTCRLKIETESGPAWSLPRCVGRADDLYFVSNDGERVWVLHPLPKRHSNGKGWLSARVATLVDRRDGVISGRQLSQLVPRDGRDDLRHLGKHVQWLEGLFGVPGVPPRVTPAGTLEFETVGGKKRVLPFR